MEIIVFFVIYLVYSLFERLVKKMREEQAKMAPPRKQPGAPQPQQTQPQGQRGSTPRPQQQPTQTQPAEELEELPRMLREILGMDIEEKPRPAPPPPPVTTPVPEPEDSFDRKAEEVEEYFARDMSSSTLDAFASKKSRGKTTAIGGGGKSGGKTTSRDRSGTYGTSNKTILSSRKLIQNKKELRKAILLKEILDRPFGLRGKPSPYIQP